MIDAAKIAEWEAAVEKASPGPWNAYSASCCPDMGGVVAGDGYRVHAATTGTAGHPATIEDAEFMAASREAIPALLAERGELLALLREVEWAVDDCGYRFCPLCDGYMPGIDVDRLEGAGAVNFRVDHAPDCRLAAALASGSRS